MRKALDGKPSVEARRHLERLLARLKTPTAGRLRGLRSVEILERVGTPKAQQVLDELVDKHTDGLLVREARATIARMSARIHP